MERNYIYIFKKALKNKNEKEIPKQSIRNG